MITAREIFKDQSDADRSKVMDYLGTNWSSRRIFKHNFTERFWADLADRRDSKIKKHLVMFTFGATGCLAGQTKLRGHTLPLCKMPHYQAVPTWSLNLRTRKRVRSSSFIISTGLKQTYRLLLDDLRYVDATEEHRFFVSVAGVIFERQLKDLRVGQLLFTLPKPMKIKNIKLLNEEDTFDISTPVYHNFILADGIVSHNSYKSGVDIEVARFMDRNFSADKIAFTDQELLDMTQRSQPHTMIIRDEVTEEFGVGSARQRAFLTMQAETLRAHQTSFGYISPTPKPIGTEHYILHAIGHNKFKMDDEGMATEPVYVLCGVQNPLTNNYLGGLIIEIEWMNKVWIEYWKKKERFLERVKDRHFDKQDFTQLATELLAMPEAEHCRNMYDWFNLIRQKHPDMTTMEMRLIQAEVKLRKRMVDA